MTGREGSGRQLTRREFDEVIRRASELAAGEAEQGEGDLPEAEIYRIAREVGLGERYVQRALSEVRSEVHTGSLTDRLIGPGAVRASRVVDRTRAELADEIDGFMVAGRLLQRVRRSADFLQYRPAVDWVSQLARAASGTSRKYFVASSRSVEVRLEALDDQRTLVEFLVDPGIRGEYLGGMVVGGGVGGLGTGVGVTALLASLMPDLAAGAAGVVAAGVVALGAVGLARRAYRRKFVDVRAEVEGVLDRLEMRETLEPPPSSWRRWVERQFHGARRLLDTGLDDDS